MTFYLIGDLIVLAMGICFGQFVSKEIVDFFRDQTKNFYAAKDMQDRFISISFSLFHVLFSVAMAIIGYFMTPFVLHVLFPTSIQPHYSAIDYVIGAALGIPLYLYTNRKALLTTKSLT